MTDPEEKISGLEPEEFEELKQQLEAQLDGKDKDVEEKLRELREKQESRLEESSAWFLDFPGVRILEKEFWRTGCLLSEDVRSYVRDYKGFMTADGSLLDYSEWHSFFTGFATVGLSYAVHPLFLAVIVSVSHRLGEDAKGSLREILKEFPYFLGGAGLGGLVFKYGLGLSLNLSQNIDVIASLVTPA